MTKRQRTLLFLFLLGLFFLIAPGLVLHSQGYRLDLQQGRITQTGAFYIKANPLRANILVDGTFVKRTDFLFGSALTKNFFPGQYAVEVGKEGYHPWQKTLEVKERQVTEAKNILLFKKDPAFHALADEVERFWISPDKNYALLERQESGKGWNLSLVNLSTKGEEPLVKQQTGQGEILDVQWAQDSSRFLLLHLAREQVVYGVYGILPGQACFQAPCSLEYLGANTGDVQFSPADEEQILFTRFLSASRTLLSAAYQDEQAPLPIASNVISFAAQGSLVTWLNAEGALWQKDLASQEVPKLFAQGARVPKQEVSSLLFAQGDAVLLKEGDALFLFERSSAGSREVLSPVTEIALSPDGTKAAVRNQSELWVLFLKEQIEQPRRQKGELVLLTRFSEPPGELFWVDSSYLLFSLARSVRTLEVDTRDRLNMADIAGFAQPKLFWNNEKGALYVLSEGAFSVSEKLVR